MALQFGAAALYVPYVRTYALLLLPNKTKKIRFGTERNDNKLRKQNENRWRSETRDVQKRIGKVLDYLIEIHRG